MPQISYFLGVIIRMFYRDHNPPHFHAVYADYEGIIDIEKNEIIGGLLPPRVLGLVTERTALHQNESNLHELLFRVIPSSLRSHPLNYS